jgi:hypothetical protein
MMMHNDNLSAFVGERDLLLPDSALNGFFIGTLISIEGV